MVPLWILARSSCHVMNPSLLLSSASHFPTLLLSLILHFSLCFSFSIFAILKKNKKIICFLYLLLYINLQSLSLLFWLPGESESCIWQPDPAGAPEHREVPQVLGWCEGEPSPGESLTPSPTTTTTITFKPGPHLQGSAEGLPAPITRFSVRIMPKSCGAISRLMMFWPGCGICVYVHEKKCVCVWLCMFCPRVLFRTVV